MCGAFDARQGRLRVLDLGCGPGAQTMNVAAALPAAHVVAIDLHAPYLQELDRRSRSVALVDRVAPVRADLHRLPVRAAAWDLVWCEGAAYIIGVAAALADWRNLLRSGGRLAFTDAVWLTDAPPPAARAFWSEYPDMTSLETRRRQLADAGWRLLGDFVLPPEAWWDDYYRPMEARIASLRGRYADAPAALAVLDACQGEIDLFRSHGDSYGYAFFVAARD